MPDESGNGPKAVVSVVDGYGFLTSFDAVDQTPRHATFTLVNPCRNRVAPFRGLTKLQARVGPVKPSQPIGAPM